MKTLLLLFLSCGLQVVAQIYPIENPNPWADDYSEIASMKHYADWGTYNVHDPAVMKVGDTYFMYSTDAIFRNRRRDEADKKIKEGNIQVRSSKDLVNWQFEGWAFDSIPVPAKTWVLEHADGKGATNIWAPFPVKIDGSHTIKSKETYRLYYCVSAFGLQTSYIGLAEAGNPLGPWVDKGCVVKTKKGDPMNAIDPSVITDAKGRMWMHYGSYFGGLYVVELDPSTGFSKNKNDQGRLTARRANYRRDNLEAPEIMYNPDTEYYYLFVSYEPLMTTYNIRVGRSKSAEGPFYDFFGKDLKDTTNNYPILTYPYQFKNHTGWAGTGHCGVISDHKGNYYLAHQARLSPEHHLMDLHIREIFWTKNDWPVLSPQRYAGEIGCGFKSDKRTNKTSNLAISSSDLVGEWEVIYVSDNPIERGLEFGQILWGENKLLQQEYNASFHIHLSTFKKSVAANSGKMHSKLPEWNGKWKFSAKNGLALFGSTYKISDLKVFVGQDWENQKRTLLFTGLDSNGRSVWGKKVEAIANGI